MKNCWVFKEGSCLLHEGSSTCRKAQESESWTAAPARGIPAMLKDTAEADQGTRAMTAAPAVHSWTHTEKVFCWLGDWLLFLLAMKEGLNVLMACSDLRLCPDPWHNTYVSNQYGLPLSETNNMWGMQVRVLVGKTTKSISVKVRKEYWKLQCLLGATMRYLNLSSVTKVIKHFGPPPKPIFCTRPEAFWGLHGTKRYSSVYRQTQKSWEVLTVYYTFLWWGSIHLEQQ